MSTASRDSWEPPFRDSARGVTHSAGFLTEGLEIVVFRQVRADLSVIPYILWVVIGSCISLLGSYPESLYISWDPSIYRLQISSAFSLTVLTPFLHGRRRLPGRPVLCQTGRRLVGLTVASFRGAQRC